MDASVGDWRKEVKLYYCNTSGYFVLTLEGCYVGADIEDTAGRLPSSELLVKFITTIDPHPQ